MARGILEVAAGASVDLIAMYTHDRKGLARIFRGSVAREVQRRASIEVRVFTPPELAGYITPEKPAEAEVPATKPGASADMSVLQSADLFRGLSDEQISQMAPAVRTMHVPAGQSLGTEGELGESIFIIASGEAQLTAHTEVGDIAARIAGPGESFPLAILVGSGNLITSAKAMTHLEVLLVDRSKLVILCSKEPKIGVRVFGNVADLFARRYGDTLRHLANSVEKELRGTGSTPSE